MIIAMVVLPLVYIAALVWLLWVAHKNKRMYATAKGLCSGLFLLCALLSGYLGRKWGLPVFALLGFALLLCAFGDVFLGVANQKATKPSRRPFLGGVASFSVAHLVFCLLFYGMLPFHWYDLALPVLILAIMFTLEKRDRVRLKKMRGPACIYAFLMALMAGKAVQMPFAYAGGLYLLSVGAVLFMVSDVILLFLYFGVRRAPWLRTANLLTYYVGVYLMAASAYWL